MTQGTLSNADRPHGSVRTVTEEKLMVFPFLLNFDEFVL